MKGLSLGHEPIHKLLMKSAAPAVIGMLLQSIYMMIDGVFVGQGTGPLGLAAVNLSMPVLQFGTALTFMLVVGGSTYTSIALGEGNAEKASNTFSMVGKTLLLSSLVFALIGSVFADSIATLAGSGSDTHSMVTSYIRILSICMPFFMSTMLLESGLRATGHPLKSMVVLSVGAVLNIALDWFFIMKLNWGVSGAAVATGISQAASTFILLHSYVNQNSIIKLKNVRIEWPVIKPVLLNGSSEFATGIALGISTYLFNIILIDLKGSLAVSAYSIIGYISQIVFMVQYGIAGGMQPIVSFNYGAGQKDRYTKTLKLAVIVSSVFAGLASLTLLMFSEPVTSLFIGQRPDLIELTMRASVFASAVYIPAGINILMSGYYTAVDNPLESAAIAIARSFVFLIAGLFILPEFFGLDGVWATMPSAELLTLGVCGIIGFLHGKQSKRKAGINKLHKAKKAVAS